jgi:hypothetical protein
MACVGPGAPVAVAGCHNRPPEAANVDSEGSMDDRIARRLGWTLALVAALAAGPGACAGAPEPRAPSASTDVPVAVVEPTPVTANCVPIRDRPAAGLATVHEIVDGGVILVREKAEEDRRAEVAPPDGLVEARRRVDSGAEPRESGRGDSPLVDRSEAGWFCFEVASDDGSGKRTSSCLRTAEECEASRGGSQAVGRAAGPCEPSAAAECYDWRVGPRSARSCFHRAEQCRRDAARRRAKAGDALHSQGCYRTK